MENTTREEKVVAYIPVLYASAYKVHRRHPDRASDAVQDAIVDILTSKTIGDDMGPGLAATVLMCRESKKFRYNKVRDNLNNFIDDFPNCDVADDSSNIKEEYFSIMDQVLKASSVRDQGIIKQLLEGVPLEKLKIPKIKQWKSRYIGKEVRDKYFDKCRKVAIIQGVGL